MSSEMQERIARAMFVRWIEVTGREPFDFSELAPEAQDEWRDLALACMKVVAWKDMPAAETTVEKGGKDG